MQIFFDELKPYDKENETLYIRFTKQDFPKLGKQFVSLSCSEWVTVGDMVREFIKSFLKFKRCSSRSSEEDRDDSSELPEDKRAADR